MAIEIMDLPIDKWWMFPSFFVIKTNPLKRRCHINQFSKKKQQFVRYISPKNIQEP